MSRVLVVGCGSIGSRRARLLAEMGHKVAVWDPRVWDMGWSPPTLLRCCDIYPSDRNAFGRPHDAAFICTPAATHLAVAREAIEAGCKALFIEKPLSTSMDGIPELIAECEARGVVTMGACNMRWGYAPWSERWYSQADILRAGFVVSGPLEGWRAGARETYETNGIILESAIHELDLALTWCGPAVGMEATQPDADSVFISTEHAGGARSVVNADWSPHATTCRMMLLALHEPRAVTNAPFPALFVEDDAFGGGRTVDGAYRSEMAHFLDCVASGTATTNPIANAAETLRWALHARDLTREVAV